MRRVLALTLVIVAAVAGSVFAAGGEDPSVAPEYVVELDNAFGLIEGGDLKIAGVRAGQITKLGLDRKSKRALVSIRIDRTGFGSLRADVRCEARPQSLIGEYFIDCLPGEAERELQPGTVIPVEQTASTIAPDLVNNILRRPFRERLAILLSELGAGVGGNAENLNAALRRASPALRETNRTLKILADQNRVLADLVRDADTVIGDLAANRTDVSRWVRETRDTAATSAQRRVELAAGFRRLPGFLRELRPTMVALGDVADAQRPALRNLGATADELERLFANLQPFSRASAPAVDALGEASKTGRAAVASATPTVDEAKRFSRGTPELAKNLAIILEHLDDREHAVEDDPRSPGGKGYTGLEALLQYVYDQSLSTNVFDENNHILKTALIEAGPCGDFADPEAAREAGESCFSHLGPSQPGVLTPDPGDPREERRPQRPQPAASSRERAARERSAEAPAAASRPDREPGRAAAPPPARPTVPDVLPPMPRLPDLPLPGGGELPLGDAAQRLGERLGGSGRSARFGVLDYLLGP